MAGAYPTLQLRDLETLIAYGKLGTQEATAEFLGVHKQTVKNRVMDAKRAIGANSVPQALWMMLNGDEQEADLLFAQGKEENDV